MGILVALVGLIAVILGFRNNWCKHKMVHQDYHKIYNNDSGKGLPIRTLEESRCEKCGHIRVTNITGQ